MIIRLATIRFNGSGFVDCRKCAHRVVFPGGAWLTAFDYGDWTLFQSVRTLAVLHRCDSTLLWQCADCGDLPEDSLRIVRRTKRGYEQLVCLCGGEYVQRRKAHEILATE